MMVQAALGATPAQLQRAVMVHAGTIAAIGILAGLAGALITSRFLRSLRLIDYPLKEPRSNGSTRFNTAMMAAA